MAGSQRLFCASPLLLCAALALVLLAQQQAAAQAMCGQAASAALCVAPCTWTGMECAGV